MEAFSIGTLKMSRVKQFKEKKEKQWNSPEFKFKSKKIFFCILY